MSTRVYHSVRQCSVDRRIIDACPWCIAVSRASATFAYDDLGGNITCRARYETGGHAAFDLTTFRDILPQSMKKEVTHE